MIQTVSNPNTTKLQELAADQINELLALYDDISVLLMFSGGSSLEILDNVDITKLSPRVTLTALDEKFSIDSSINNFQKIKATNFFQGAKLAGCHFMDTTVNNSDTVEDFSKYWQDQLQKWFRVNSKGKIIAIQETGNDGHTVDIVPFTNDPKLFNDTFVNTQDWITHYNIGNKDKHPLRVTVTINFLENLVHHCIFYDEANQNIVSKLLEKPLPMYLNPASVIYKMKNVYVFTNTFVNNLEAEQKAKWERPIREFQDERRIEI